MTQRSAQRLQGQSSCRGSRLTLAVPVGASDCMRLSTSCQGRVERPTRGGPACRAEATDVANAVLDGVDGILLGAETLRGLYPRAVVETTLHICKQAEKVFDHREHFDRLMQARACLHIGLLPGEHGPLKRPVPHACGLCLAELTTRALPGRCPSTGCCGSLHLTSTATRCACDHPKGHTCALLSHAPACAPPCCAQTGTHAAQLPCDGRLFGCQDAQEASLEGQASGLDDEPGSASFRGMGSRNVFSSQVDSEQNVRCPRPAPWAASWSLSSCCQRRASMQKRPMPCQDLPAGHTSSLSHWGACSWLVLEAGRN